MIKAVVTDFDGVIRHYQQGRTQAIEQQLKLNDGALLTICEDPELKQAALTGKISFEQWSAEIHERLSQSYGPGVAQHSLEAWSVNHFDIDHSLIRFFRKAFPHAQLALAANASTKLPQELREAGLHHRFDRVFNSSAMGVLIPQAEFFNAMLMTMGIKARETLFIDDQLANVRAAKKLGLAAYHFKNRTALVKVLTDIARKTQQVTNGPLSEA